MGGGWTCPGSFKKFELKLLYLSTQERHRIGPIPDYVHKLLLEIKYGLDGAGTQLVIQGKAIKTLTSIGHPVQSLLHVAYAHLEMQDMVRYCFFLDR